jgi:hypothetical protein
LYFAFPENRNDPIQSSIHHWLRFQSCCLQAQGCSTL